MHKMTVKSTHRIVSVTEILVESHNKILHIWLYFTLAFHLLLINPFPPDTLYFP